MSEGADAKMTLSGGKTSCSSGLVKCANVTSGIKGDYVLNCNFRITHFGYRRF